MALSAQDQQVRRLIVDQFEGTRSRSVDVMDEKMLFLMAKATTISISFHRFDIMPARALLLKLKRFVKAAVGATRVIWRRVSLAAAAANARIKGLLPVAFHIIQTRLARPDLIGCTRLVKTLHADPLFFRSLFALRPDLRVLCKVIDTAGHTRESGFRAVDTQTVCLTLFVLLERAAGLFGQMFMAQRSPYCCRTGADNALAGVLQTISSFLARLCSLFPMLLAKGQARNRGLLASHTKTQ